MYRKRDSLTVTAENSLGENEQFEVESHADMCPVCHVAAEPAMYTAFALGRGDKAHMLEVVYRCPRNECRAAYISLFARPRDNHGRYEGPFSFRRSEPSKPEEPDLPEAVVAMSPRFVEVYAQAFAAEAYGLIEIAGPGYRKALEMLIKDFIGGHLVGGAEERAQVTNNTRLGAIVDQYFGTSKLSQVLHRVAWLGNDEVHYARRWDDKDLADLHALLKIAVNMIDTELVASAYINGMNPQRESAGIPNE